MQAARQQSGMQVACQLIFDFFSSHVDAGRAGPHTSPMHTNFARYAKRRTFDLAMAGRQDAVDLLARWASKPVLECSLNAGMFWIWTR